jgi:hypothetical protein
MGKVSMKQLRPFLFTLSTPSEHSVFLVSSRKEFLRLYLISALRVVIWWGGLISVGILGIAGPNPFFITILLIVYGLLLYSAYLWRKRLLQLQVTFVETNCQGPLITQRIPAYIRKPAMFSFACIWILFAMKMGFNSMTAGLAGAAIVTPIAVYRTERLLKKAWRVADKTTAGIGDK